MAALEDCSILKNYLLQWIKQKDGKVEETS